MRDGGRCEARVCVDSQTEAGCEGIKIDDDSGGGDDDDDTQEEEDRDRSG